MNKAQLVGMGADAGGGPGDPAAGGVNVLRLPSPVHPPGALSPPTVPLPPGGREREGRASEWGKGGGVRGSGRAGAGTQGRAQERAWVEGGSSAAAGAGFGRGHGDGASLAHAASASSTMVVLGGAEGPRLLVPGGGGPGGVNQTGRRCNFTSWERVG